MLSAGENGGENSENGDVERNATFSQAIEMLNNAHDKLWDQNVKPAASVKIKEKVFHEIGTVIEVITALRDRFSDNAVTSLNKTTEQLKTSSPL